MCSLRTACSSFVSLTVLSENESAVLYDGLLGKVTRFSIVACKFRID
jgi:hypothetical protein